MLKLDFAGHLNRITPGYILVACLGAVCASAVLQSTEYALVLCVVADVT